MPEIGQMHRDKEGIIGLYGSNRGILIKASRNRISATEGQFGAGFGKKIGAGEIDWYLDTEALET